jgi:hypothetical protein
MVTCPSTNNNNKRIDVHYRDNQSQYQYQNNQNQNGYYQNLALASGYSGVNNARSYSSYGCSSGGEFDDSTADGKTYLGEDAYGYGYSNGN